MPRGAALNTRGAAPARCLCAGTLTPTQRPRSCAVPLMTGPPKTAPTTSASAKLAGVTAEDYSLKSHSIRASPIMAIASTIG